MKTKLIQTKDYLLLIDKEAEIKENTNTFKEGFNGDWFWNSKYNSIQRIGDITEFDFKIISFYPLTKEAKELEKLPLLPNPFENSFDITKWAKEEHKYNHRSIHELSFILGCEVGYEKAQSKQFSLDDILQAIKKHQYKHTDDLDQTACPVKGAEYRYIVDVEDIENELKSLSTQQLPKEFIPEYEIVYFHGSGYYEESQLSLEEREKYSFMKEQRIKTITNSEGKEEIQGRFVY